ncbi:MAG: hypothetical protein ACREJQ_00195 [bacterium]
MKKVAPFVVALVVLVIVVAIAALAKKPVPPSSSSPEVAGVASAHIASAIEPRRSEVAVMRSFFQYEFNEYAIRFVSAPTSFDDLSKHGVAFIPMTNYLTGRPLKNSCGQPSPGDYCFDSAAQQYFFWDKNGKYDENTPDPVHWPARFESWKTNSTKSANGAGIYEQGRKAGYTEEDLDWLMAGMVFSYRLPARYCERGIRDPNDLKAATWVFPYTEMGVRGQPFAEHFSFTKNGDHIVYEVLGRDKKRTILKMELGVYSNPDGTTNCHGEHTVPHADHQPPA